MAKRLRTPESRFEVITDFPFQPNYYESSYGRMHYIDEGDGEIILCLHGEPSWSYLYRKFIPILSPKHRVIAPDFIGFGKSDKLTKIKDYNYQMHLQCLEELINKNQWKNITIVVQDWGGLLGLGLVGKYPEWFDRLVIMNTFLPIGNRKMPFVFKLWKAFAKYYPSLPIGRILKMGTYLPLSKATKYAYDAPFPSKKFKAGAKAFPLMVPSKPTDNGVEEMKEARSVLKNWHKPALILFSDKDPIMRGGERFFAGTIPFYRNKKPIIIKDAGHFLQEDKGEEIATHILNFMEA